MTVHKTIKTIIRDIYLSDDNKYILSADHRNLYLWDTKSGKLIKGILVDFHCIIHTIFLSKDNKYILVGGFKEYSNEFGEYDHDPENQNAIIDIFKFKDQKIFFYKSFSEESMSCVISAFISSDNKFVFSGNINGIITKYDLHNGKIVNTFETKDRIITIYLSKDDKFLVSGGYDKTVKIYNVKKKKIINILKGHTKHICSVYISDDNEYIISGSKDCSIRIWNFKNCKNIKIIKTLSSIRTVSISRNNKFILSGNMENKIQIWDFNTGKIICDLNKDKGFIIKVFFSIDNDFLVSGSSCKEIEGNKIKLFPYFNLLLFIFLISCFIFLKTS